MKEKSPRGGDQGDPAGRNQTKVGLKEKNGFDLLEEVEEEIRPRWD